MANNPNIQNIHQRQRARKKLLQALYQWMLNPSPASVIEQQFASIQPDFKKIDLAFYRTAMHQITLNYPAASATLTPFLDIKFEQLDPLEKGILMIGWYELTHHLETPYKVVINEMIDLSKRFAGEDSHKFINAVMDKLSKSIRTLERS